MNHLFSFVFLLLLSCQNGPNSTQEATVDREVSALDTSYRWTKVLDSAAWRKNYNFQLFSIRDTLWVFHPDGTWFATDGITWQKSTLPNAIKNQAFLDYVEFKGAVYGLGYLDGNIEQFEFRPEIFKTSDLKTWTTLSRDSNLPKRFFYHPFVFDDKIWIIGGEDPNTRYSDIWNSADGIQWIKQKDNLPFGPRSGSQIVLLQDTLYLLDHDVWRSTDGLNWEQVTEEIVPGEMLFGYSAQIFDDQIWLLGCNRNGQFTSQVLVSSDGKNWSSQNAPWLPRGGIAATVHDHKIYLTGGKYGGTPNHPEFRYDNDLWTLEKK